MNIAVAGTGYVGLSIATLIAQHNHVTAKNGRTVDNHQLTGICRRKQPDLKTHLALNRFLSTSINFLL